MKRLPQLAILLMFIAVSVSAAYWGMQFFKPTSRAVAAPQQVVEVNVNLEAASNLFGGRASPVAVASNYQLKGIVLAGTSKESIAILSTDGKPAQAIIVNTEVVPGVTLKEVHAQYILLSEGGIAKRVDLPEGVKAMVGEAQLSPISPTGQANPSMPAALTGNSKMRMEESEQEKPNEALSR